LQSSGDLLAWEPDPSAAIVRIVDNGDGTETITIVSTEPLGASPRLFLRLHLTSLE
jgi:hypothetical protein